MNTKKKYEQAIGELYTYQYLKFDWGLAIDRRYPVLVIPIEIYKRNRIYFYKLQVIGKYDILKQRHQENIDISCNAFFAHSTIGTTL